MKLIRFCSVLAVASLFFATRSALADFELQLSTTGLDGSYTTEASAPSGTAASTGLTPITFGGYSIQLLSGSSNSPGTPAGAQLLGVSLNIQNVSGSTPLYIKIGDTGFTNPQTPPALILSSSVGGSYTTTHSGDSLVFQSYLDSSNGQNTTTGFTPGTQNVSFANSSGNAASFNSSASTDIASLTSTFSLTQYLKITLAQNDQMGFQATTELTTPEPASLTLWGLGLVAGGIVARRRRRA